MNDDNNIINTIRKIKYKKIIDKAVFSTNAIKSKYDDIVRKKNKDKLIDSIRKQEEHIAYNSTESSHEIIYLSLMSEMLKNIEQSSNDNIKEREELFLEIYRNWIVDDKKISEAKRRYYRSITDRVCKQDSTQDHNSGDTVSKMKKIFEEF